MVALNSPDTSKQIPIITNRDVEEFRRIRDKVDSINGPNVKNEPRRISIGTPATSQRGSVPTRATLPVPQYQEMVLKAVAQNVLGAGYVSAHGLR